MVYVLDTNIFREIFEHLPKQGKVFEHIRQVFENGIQNGVFLSVDECFNELAAHYDEKNEGFQWIKNNKKIFLPPTNEESCIIKQIFMDGKMRENIHQKNILSNRPSADPYIVAKAKTLAATVVTKEKYKPNSAQIPNICELIGIPCISYDDFMEILSNENTEIL